MENEIPVKRVLHDLRDFFNALDENEYERYGFLKNAKNHIFDQFPCANEISLQCHGDISFAIVTSPIKSLLVVGIINNSVVGFSIFNNQCTSLEYYFPDRNIIEFHLLYLKDEYRQKGYSKVFFEIMENVAKTYDHIEMLVLSVALEHSTNCSCDLFKLYEKRGFSKSHISYKYIGVNNDDQTSHVVVGKPLPKGTEFKEIGYLMYKDITK